MRRRKLCGVCAVRDAVTLLFFIINFITFLYAEVSPMRPPSANKHEHLTRSVVTLKLVAADVQISQRILRSLLNLVLQLSLFDFLE